MENNCQLCGRKGIHLTKNYLIPREEGGSEKILR